MARDPNITVHERLVRAARRWAAIDGFLECPSEEIMDELGARVSELQDAVRALEKHEGMRGLTFKVRPILRRPKRRRSSANKSDGKEGR
jgi:hypothetical protein